MADEFLHGLTDSWNSALTAFDGIKLNVTDSASDAESRLMALQIGGDDKFEVRKDGRLQITNNDAGAGVGPTFSLFRDSSSPAASDLLGQLLFKGRDGAGNIEDYAEIRASLDDPADGTEDASLLFTAALDGTLTTFATLGATGLVLGTDVAISFAGTGAAATLTNLGVPTSYLPRIEAEGTIASTATTDIGAQATYRLDVTGTETITSLGITANSRKLLRFSGALTLTHNATSLILPGEANITTAAGDVFEFASDGAGNWRCVGYALANGQPIVGAFSGSFTNAFGEVFTLAFASGAQDAAFEFTYGGGTPFSISDQGVMTVKDVVITG